ncbi:MAG: HAD-IIB family hydrolase [Candidatus Moraniibacteriota bacterium]
MTKIRLILSDIDGCLCGKLYDFLPLGQIREYCERVQRGQSLPAFAFATGRGGEYVDCLARMLNAYMPGNVPSIIENGTFLFRPEGRIYIPHPALSGKENLIVEVRASVTALLKSGEVRLIGGKDGCLSLKPVDESADMDRLEENVRSVIDPDLREQLFVTHSTTAIDITVRGVNKGSCLHFLCEQTGVRPEDILAIGDTAGDIPILKEVGFPACPGNANKEVKELVSRKGGYVARAEFAWGVVEIMKNFKLI